MRIRRRRPRLEDLLPHGGIIAGAFRRMGIAEDEIRRAYPSGGEPRELFLACCPSALIQGLTDDVWAVKISTSLDAGRGAALRRLADALGSTPSALAREALVDLLERRKSEIPPAAPDPRQTTMFDDPAPDFLADLFAEATA